MSEVPRLRMYAGPNGSGKSTIKSVIRHSNRAYIFDNSGHSKIWLAEVSDGKFLTMKTDRMPEWFKTAVWDRMGSAESEKS